MTNSLKQQAEEYALKRFNEQLDELYEDDSDYYIVRDGKFIEFTEEEAAEIYYQYKHNHCL